MKDSSAPVRPAGSRARRATGSARRARASSSSTATAARLSLAPGTTHADADLADDERGEQAAAAAGAAQPAPAEQRAQRQRAAGRRRRAASAAATSPGGRTSPGTCRRPPRRAGMEDEAAVGGVVVGDEDHRLARVRVARSATTFVVTLRGSAARRNQWAPPETSSAIPAAAARAGEPRARAAAAAEPGGGAERREQRRPARGSCPCAGSSSSRGRHALGRQRARIHSAAARSPAEAGGRSIACRPRRWRAGDRGRGRASGAEYEVGGGRRRGCRSVPAMSDPDCLFCKIVAGELPATVVREDERTIAFMDINPATRGHALVVPRDARHATSGGRRGGPCRPAPCGAGHRDAGARPARRPRRQPPQLVRRGCLADRLPLPRARDPALRGRPAAAAVGPGAGRADEIAAAGAQLGG